MPSTIAQRMQMWSDLRRRWDSWIRMSDSDLLWEVKKILPSVTEATRDKCLKFLTMHYTERMIGGK